MFDRTGQLPDKNLLSAILALLAFGWIMSFSASLGQFGSYSYFFKQTIFITLGLSLGYTALKVPLYFYKNNSKLLFIITLIFLALVFLPEPIGRTVKGSTRWINFVFFKFQPSEMMKLVMILFMAGFLVRQEKDLRKPYMGFAKTIVIIGLSSVLLLLEPDIGATFIISATAFAMLLAAGVYLKQLFVVGSIVAGVFTVVLFQIPNRVERLMSFWQKDLWLNDSERVYQTKHVKP